MESRSYGELCSSVAEAAQHHIATEDVKKAEGPDCLATPKSWLSDMLETWRLYTNRHAHWQA